MSPEGVIFFNYAIVTCENICALPPTHSFSSAVPRGVCRSRCSSKSLRMENNICNFNWMPYFALPFLNCYTGQCFSWDKTASQCERCYSVPLNYHLQGAYNNPWSNTCCAYSASAPEKDKLEPIIYLSAFLLFFFFQFRINDYILKMINEHYQKSLLRPCFCVLFRLPLTLRTKAYCFHERIS